MEVVLRPWLQKDLVPLVALANNRKIWDNVRDVFPHPYTKEDAKEWLLLNVDVTPVLNYVIEVDGEFAGSIGMVPKTDILRNNMEIGYWLGEPYWGKGVISKSIELVCAIIWKEFPEVNRIYAEVFEHNAPSMKALQRNGFLLECIRKNGIIKNEVMMDDHVWVKFRS